MTEDYTLPVAAFAPTTLEGEPPTDKAFVSDGVTYRVRLAVADISALVIATAGDAIAPSRRDIDLTVTELGDDGLPLRDSAGNVIIVAQTRWTDDRNFVNAKSPADTLDMMIGHLIHQAKGRATATLEIDALLNDWGGGIVETSTPSAQTSRDPIADLPEEMRPNLPNMIAEPPETET